MPGLSQHAIRRRMKRERAPGKDKGRMAVYALETESAFLLDNLKRYQETRNTDYLWTAREVNLRAAKRAYAKLQWLAKRGEPEPRGISSALLEYQRATYAFSKISKTEHRQSATLGG